MMFRFYCCLTLNMFFFLSEIFVYFLWKISLCYQETMCGSALLVGVRHGCFSGILTRKYFSFFYLLMYQWLPELDIHVIK